MLTGQPLLQAIYYMDKSEDQENLCTKKYVWIQAHQGRKQIFELIFGLCTFKAVQDKIFLFDNLKKKSEQMLKWCHVDLYES